MDEQEEKNQASSFEKQSHGKALNKLNDLQRKNKKVNKIVTLIKAKKIIIPLLIILGVVVLLVMFSNFVSLVYNLSINSINSAKKSAISTSYSTGSETGDPNGNTFVNSSRVVVKPTKNKDAYEISNNYTDEEIKKLREELENDTSRSLNDFSDFEIAIIGALAENGLDIDDWNLSELKCFPAFIKAEACTQYLDLRSNKEKNTEKTSDNYKPRQLKDLKDNEVPGVILVQRTNTNENEHKPLEYMEELEFNKLVDANDEKSINYFTLNDKGNLVIAKWNMEEITVTGEYPENLPEEEKEKSTGKVYNITTEEIAYGQYITKYTMPFELLVQLLSILEDPDFCMELVDYVMGSKIVINIQEEETYTHTVEERTYTVHSKDEKRIDYQIASVVKIEENKDYLLGNAKDDNGETCTNYEVNYKKVTVDRQYTSHSYVFDIIEADTWVAHYTKTYLDSTTKKEPTVTNQITDKPEQYTEINTDKQPITDTNEILKDKDVKKFKDEKEKYYKDLITIPKIKLDLGTKYIWDVLTNQFIEIPGDDEINITPKDKIESTSLPNGKTTYKFEHDKLPSQINVTTIKEKELPSIRFTYYLNNGKYTTADTKEQIAQCNVTKVDIKEFERIDTVNNKTEDVTRYESDPNPVKRVDLYDKVDKKFLQAYDKSERAQHMMRSVSSWLFEVMEEDERTVEFIDIIKYLLYKYDGTNYGVTELNLEIFFATDMNNASSGNSMQQFLQFLHSWEGGGTIYKDAQGVDCYKVQSDGGEGSAVGYGVDIGTHGNRLRLLGYDTSIGSLIPVEIVDEIEKESIQKSIDNIKMKTSELDLTEYQIYALVSRCYNYGDTGGLGQATWKYKYPSNETFVSAYKKYYSNINNDDYFGDYTKTDFNNGLFTSYMTWLDYVDSGTHPAGWEYRRRSEWSLFQTGYYGYDLKNGKGHGMDEYYTSVGGATDFTNNINLYNGDGSVNTDSINQLNSWLTTDLLNTKIHSKNYEMQGGPFAKWWDSSNNWFTSAGYRFQCTWYVYGRANQFLEANGTLYKSWPGTRNDAGKWYSSSTNGGEKYFECGNTPRQNSIVVWKDGNNAGHVAYVEAVDTINNKVYISHAGGGRSWFGITSHGINEMKSLWGYQLLGYVYLDSPKK